MPLSELLLLHTYSTFFHSINEVNISYALRVFEYLDAEMDYPPWRAALSELFFLETMLRTRASYGNFEVSRL